MGSVMVSTSGPTYVDANVVFLREAARLRATIPRLRTPDALHAATALMHGVVSFVTNDVAFRNIPGLNVEILDEMVPHAAVS